ncbi:MAG: YicC family protein, partial [Methylococcales bacterium]
MIRSMTAFAGCETEIGGVHYAWEIRTVNHRYLEIMLRIPENLRVLEPGFRALIGQQLKRGKIDCFLNLRQADAMHNAIHIDRQGLRALIEIMREIESEIHDTLPCSALDILRWPGIAAEQTVDPQALEKPLCEILHTALTRVIECREREGLQLAEVLRDRCERLQQQIRLLRLRLPEIVEKLRSRLHSRIKEMTAEVDPLRFEQEIAFLLQKMDVDEEIERL